MTGNTAIITGSRHGHINAEKQNKLVKLFREHNIGLVIQGGATGIDSEAKMIAEWCGIKVKTFPADWSLGPRGGRRRNFQMAEFASKQEGKRFCFAFPGGSGTNDMKEKAELFSLKVIEV